VMAPEITFELEGNPVLEFQPVIDLSDGRLLGMEALIRWDHPRLGRLTPGQLIPRAETNGDILALSRWVLAEACGLAATWSSSVQLAVNCTLSQLRNGDASRSVTAALETSGLEPGRLTLEITEDTVADSDAFEDLRTLSSLGVELAVDDVGTNWSSFEPLRRLAVNTVKIDGSFVAGLEPTQGINRLVVETVIHMAHSLGMATIAEGVETAAQVALVREFEADAAQGYFFAHPMSPEEATAMAATDVVPRFSRTEPTTLVPAKVNGHAADSNGSGERTTGREVDGEPVGGSPESGAVAGSSEDADTEATADDQPSPGDAVTDDVPTEADEPKSPATRPARAGSGSGRGGSGSTAGGGKRTGSAKKPAKGSATRKAPAPKRPAGPSSDSGA